MNLNIARHVNNILADSKYVEYVQENPEVILIGFLSFLFFMIVMCLWEWGKIKNKVYG